MNRAWARKFKKCQQCGTKRFKQVAKGLCTRCYRLVKRLEEIGRWNLSDPNSLVGCPEELVFHKPEKFERVKLNVTQQIKDRLDQLKIREETLKGKIYGIDIEFQLQHIVSQCRVRNKELLFGIADVIDEYFSMKQKKLLYELLNEIEEAIPWKGVDYFEVALRSVPRRFVAPADATPGTAADLPSSAIPFRKNF